MKTAGKPKASAKSGRPSHGGGAKQRAPTLYVIIACKLLKGGLFVVLACVTYALSDNNLPDEYRHWLKLIRANPEKKFWSDLAIQVGTVTETQMLRAAVGTLIYSLFSLVEGVGLIFRVPWAGWMAIGESAFFIPIEIADLVHKTNHAGVVTGILVFNILIVWYLFQNRERLFKHH